MSFYDKQLDRLNAIEEVLTYALGVDGLLDNILLSMSSDEKEKTFEYIARYHDIDIDSIE